MGRLGVVFGLGSLLAIAGCGGAGGEPLISGSLSGNYKGEAFTPAFGFATVYEGQAVVAVGEAALNCGSLESQTPPGGLNALIEVPALETGSYSSVFVHIYSYKGGHFDSHSSNVGTVTLTAVSGDAVAGSVEYSDTDYEGETQALSGSFEVMRCPG